MEEEENIWYEINFGQVTVNSSPRMMEGDGSYQAVFPHQARLRNLTYSVEMYVDVSVTKLREVVGDERKQMKQQYTENDADTGEGRKFDKIKELPTVNVFLGKAPVMIRSNFCHLKNMDDLDITKQAKECVFDQGGYFIINGSEKVIIANERMASNIVLVFHKKPPSKHSWVAEIRSQADNSNKPPLQFKVAMNSKGNS